MSHCRLRLARTDELEQLVRIDDEAYSHLSWNRPYYERHGFIAVPDQACGPKLRELLQAQRDALPDPSQRIAMVRKALAGASGGGDQGGFGVGGIPDFVIDSSISPRQHWISMSWFANNRFNATHSHVTR